MKTTLATKLTQQSTKSFRLLAIGLTVLATGQAFAGDAHRAHPLRHAMADALKAADTNKDDQISRAEADAGLPKVAKRFDVLDRNKDGQISADEFKAGHRAAMQMRGAKIDTDKDGFVTRAEAEANAPRLAKHFDKIDANGDGKLSHEEMLAARAKMHKKGA